MDIKPFDSTVDYFDTLTDKEKVKGEYPLLRGLQRLAHTYRGGVRNTSSHVVCSPQRENPIAVVEFRVEFNDGTFFMGAADATPTAHKAPYHFHLVAVAEAKAESRALRRAFNIHKVAFEEIGEQSEVVGEPDNVPISDAQIEGIKKIAQRKKLGKADVLRLIHREDALELNELTASEGREAMKAVNKAQMKIISVETKPIEVKQEGVTQ